MMEQTNDFNKLRLNFNYRRGKVNIYRDNINALKCPRFVKFMISPERKLLFLCGVDIHELDCFPVPYDTSADDKKKAKQMELSGTAFIRKICNIVGWSLEYAHVVEGVLDEENRWILFDLTKEVPMSEWRQY